MLNLFARALRPFVADDAPPATVPPLARSYVESLTLDGLPNIFDADALWARPTPLFRDNRRLRGMLEDRAYRIGSASYVFAHLVVELPADEVNYDLQIASGERCANLAADLQHLLQESFGKRFAGGRTARVAVRAGDDLAPASARIKFGHGIYVRDEASDQAAWRVESSTDAQTWSECHVIQHGQRLTVLGADSASVTASAAGWPFGDDVSLVLTHDPEQPRLNLGAEPRGSLTITHNRRLDCEEIGDASGQVFYLQATALRPIRRPQPVVTPQATTPRAPVTRVSADAPPVRREPRLMPADQTDGDKFPASAAETVATPAIRVAEVLRDQRPPAVQEESEAGTLLVPRKRPSLPGYSMTLIGIALPRLSVYQAHGIDSLSFGFDRQGQIVPPTAPERLIAVRIGEDDRFHVETSGGTLELAVGEAVPISGERKFELRALPTEADDRYLGWCPLPTPTSERLAGGQRCTVGRKESALRHLRVLDRNGVLSGSRANMSADHLGLSRQHCHFEVVADGLVVTLLSQSSVLHLDAEMKFVEELDAEVKLTWLIERGHHLVLGNYVLRYDA